MTTTPEATKGVPRIEGNPSPTFRGDFNALADWVRDNTTPSVAATTSLPTTGNWVGRTIFVTAEDSPYIYKSSALGWQRASKKSETVNFSGQSDASAYISVTHTLGVVPDVELVTLRASANDSITLIQDCVVWAKSNNAVLLRFVRRDTNAYFAGNPFNGSLFVARTSF